MSSASVCNIHYVQTFLWDLSVFAGLAQVESFMHSIYIYWKKKKKPNSPPAAEVIVHNIFFLLHFLSWLGKTYVSWWVRGPKASLPWRRAALGLPGMSCERETCSWERWMGNCTTPEFTVGTTKSLTSQVVDANVCVYISFEGLLIIPLEFLFMLHV